MRISIGRNPSWRTPSLRPAIPSPGCGRRSACKSSTPPHTGQGPAAQAAGKASQTAASAAKKGGGTIAQKLGGFVTKNKHTLLIVGGIGLILMLIMGLMQACTSMFGGGTSGLVASSYLSEDADLTGAEAAYCEMEAELQEYLDTYEATHDYDDAVHPVGASRGGVHPGRGARGSGNAL